VVLVIATLRAAGADFVAKRTVRMGAGLAYYAIIALVPLLILMVAVAGLLVGEAAASGELAVELDSVLGNQVAGLLQDAIVQLNLIGSFANLTIFSIIALVFAASILFVAWKDALNLMWGTAERGGVRESLRERLFALAVVGVAGLLLSAVLVAQALLAMLGNIVPDQPLIDTLLRVASSSIPLLLSTVLLGLLYRFGPDTKLAWGDIWPGTLVAVLLLLVTVWLYGVYVTNFADSSATGVAGAALLLVVLVYFAAQIVLFGAEIIYVRSLTRFSVLVEGGLRTEVEAVHED